MILFLSKYIIKHFIKSRLNTNLPDRNNCPMFVLVVIVRNGNYLRHREHLCMYTKTSLSVELHSISCLLSVGIEQKLSCVELTPGSI